MKAYLAIKYHHDGENRARIESISRVLTQVGLASVCVFRDIERWGAVELAPKDLMRRSFQEIDGCQIMLVDLTEKGVGVGIEAGYAFARGVPIVAIAEAGSAISTTLSGIAASTIHYESESGLLNLLTIALSDIFPAARAQTP